MTTAALERRNFLSYGYRRAIEIIAALPLAGMLVRSAFDKGKHNEIDISQAFSARDKSAMLELDELGKAYADSLDALEESYSTAYRSTRLVPRTSIDADGDISITLDSETVWSEPPHIPDHHEIYDWRRNADDFNDKTRYIMETPLLDHKEISKIKINEAYTNRALQAILSTIVFGSEAAALMGYEEAMAWKGYRDRFRSPRKMSLGDIVEKTNSPTQLKRRTFLKLGASLAGLAVVYNLHSSKEENMEYERARTLDRLGSMSGLEMQDGSEIFMAYYDLSIKDHAGILSSRADRISGSLEQGVKYDNVRKAMMGFLDASQSYGNRISSYESKGLPLQAVDTMRDALVTKFVDELSGRIRSGGVDVLVEGLAVGATLGLILIPGEYANSRFDGKQPENAG